MLDSTKHVSWPTPAQGPGEQIGLLDELLDCPAHSFQNSGFGFDPNVSQTDRTVSLQHFFQVLMTESCTCRASHETPESL